MFYGVPEAIEYPKSEFLFYTCILIAAATAILWTTTHQFPTTTIFWKLIRFVSYAVLFGVTAIAALGWLRTIKAMRGQSRLVQSAERDP
jgi:hypothetical protein